jgi:hypothetical protein
VHKGDRVSFWHDTWTWGIPLKTKFSSIFAICQDPEALVSENWNNGEWDIPLRRSLIGESLYEWGELHERLQNVQADGQGEDQVYWALEKSRVYSTKSLYNCLTHGEVNDKLNDLIRKSKIPLKE